MPTSGKNLKLRSHGPKVSIEPALAEDVKRLQSMLWPDKTFPAALNLVLKVGVSTVFKLGFEELARGCDFDRTNS